MKGSDYIINFLVSKGVCHIFGYPGAVVCHLMDSAYKHNGMQMHLNYHEQASAFAACGYAMSTGKVAVAYANGGPGMTNLITGIADAWYDSLPVIFIVGQVDTTAMRNKLQIRQRGIQEIPSAKIVKEIVKYSDVVSDISKLRFCVEKAYHVAVSERPGPVLLEIPADIQRADIDIENSVSFNPDTTIKDDRGLGYMTVVEKALKKAKRPCILIGNGVKVSGNYPALIPMLKHLRVPVLSTLPALDCLPFEHSLNFGFVGNNGNRYSNFILGKSDLIISVGCRMDVKVVGNNRSIFATNAKFIRVDVDEKELTYKVREDEIDVCADAGKFIENLTILKYDKDNSDWLHVCKELKEKFYGYDFREYHNILQILLDKADRASCFTTDVGQHEIYTLQALRLKEEQRIAISSGLASMGFGIPAAIGAYYSSERPVVCACGDGGFLMNVQELQYIARERIPVKIIVFNNNSLGMIREFQNRNFEGKCVHSTGEFGYGCPDIKAIADSYSLDYKKVKNRDDAKKIDMNSKSPFIIELFIHEPTELYPRFKRDFRVQDMVPEISADDYKWAMKL